MASEERDKVLDMMLGIRGRAAASRGKVQDTKKRLDAAGLEAKAKKPDAAPAKDKAVLDELRASVAAAVGEWIDSPPPELVDAVMATVVQAGMESAPAPEAETQPAEEMPPMTEEAAIDEAIPVEEDNTQEEKDEDYDGEEKSYTLKAAQLIDTLMSDQATVIQEVAESNKALRALLPLVELVPKLETQMKAQAEQIAVLEKQLKGRPRMASRAPETEVELDGLPDEVRKSLVRRDGFWGANLMPEDK